MMRVPLDQVNTSLETIVKVSLSPATSEYLSLDNASRRACAPCQLAQRGCKHAELTELLCSFVCLLGCLGGYAPWSRDTILRE